MSMKIGLPSWNIFSEKRECFDDICLGENSFFSCLYRISLSHQNAPIASILTRLLNSLPLPILFLEEIWMREVDSLCLVLGCLYASVRSLCACGLFSCKSLFWSLNLLFKTLSQITRYGKSVFLLMSKCLFGWCSMDKLTLAMCLKGGDLFLVFYPHRCLQCEGGWGGCWLRVLY